jgi:type VI secretion system protein ImpL
MVIQIIGILALCILIWFVGPLLAIAGKVLLKSDASRLTAILIVVVVWALYNLIKQSRSQKKEQKLMDDLAAPEEDSNRSAIEEAQSKEITDLQKKFEYALKLLKSTRSKGWQGQQFLYELPWYVIIGAPGCGKTTLLENSELNFPLADKFDQIDVKGVGGTRNCDWLFTDEAVFLDTAGRYTTQDSHQPVDSAAWRNFLELIKKYRPRRPINGVLVAVSISDLLRQTEEESRNQAGLIRNRISELTKVLGMRFPIYMTFTKCDLVAGFTDFFAPLGREERAQVWGETFQAFDSKQPQTAISDFMHTFDRLIHRLDQWTFRRIQDERDLKRRSLILGFPRQMMFFKPKMNRFLQQLFSTSRYEKHIPLLRGIYFTSATQEGTPIDRVMSLLASNYDLDRQQVPVLSQKSKSYFIHRLLKNVIFQEAQLAGVSLKVERRHRLLQVTAYGSVVILSAGLIGLWSTIYLYNKNAMEHIKNKIEQYENTPEDTSTWDSAVRSLHRRLNSIKAAGQAYGGDSNWMEFGLNQKEKLYAGIEMLYKRLLHHRFLPVVKARLEQCIHTNISGTTDDETAALYELLKIYLMLGEPQKRLDTGLAKKRINSDWQNSFAREPDFQQDLCGFTDALFKLSLDPIQLNDPLIAKARLTLNKQPLYAQIYTHIKSESMADHTHDIYLKEVLPPHFEKVFTAVDGQDIEALMIPGFFTYAGYHGVFKKKGSDYTKQVLKENWVTDNYAADQESDLSRLLEDVQKQYFDEYEKYWLGLLHNLNMKRPTGISQEIQILDLLSGLETPLRPLLEVIEKNTTLSKLPQPKVSEKQKTGAKAMASLTGHDLEASEEMQTLASLGKDGLQEGNTSPRIVALEEKFKDINYLIRSEGDTPAPIDQILTGLNNVRDYMMQISGAVDSDERALEMAMERIQGSGASEKIKAAQMEFARQPEPFKTWFSSLTSSSLSFTLTSAISELNANWKNEIVTFYKKSLEGRYPLSEDSPYDITFDDFSNFFKPSGLLDNFFNSHLKPFVDAGQGTWRPRIIENHAMNLSSKTLTQLQYAAKIRDAFFPVGGDAPSVQFELRPVDLDNDIASFRIEIEGQKTEYSHGPTRSKKFVWPGPNTDSGIRLTVKTIDGEEVDYREEGPWAWLKILDKAAAKSTNQSDWFMITFKLGRYQAYYELRADSVDNPFQISELKKFRCPESF